MLAPQDNDPRIDTLRLSLASDIVELVVLTADESFLQTLREAVGPSRRLWHVPSSDKVGDLLLAGGVGILVLDAQVLQQAGTAFIAQIKRQFPDLVVVVAGTRDTEIELARQISDGSVYRFIHKPMSPARARLFADAAVRRYDEQRKRSGPAAAGTARPTGRRGRLIVGGCALICALGVTLWSLTRPDRRPSVTAVGAAARVTDDADKNAYASDPESRLLARAADAMAANRLVEPPGDNALELYLQVAARNPASADARSGVTAVRERLLARAQNAVLEERLDEAAAAVETARRAGVESGRIALLAAELAKARGDHRAATAARVAAAATPPAMPPAAASPVAASPAAASPVAAVESARANASPEGAPAAGASVAGAFDSGAPAPDDAAETPVIDAAALSVVNSVQPDYPRKAREDSVEGWVELEFTVTPSGEVKDAAVTASSPRGVFDQAALTALSRWRYEPVRIGAAPVARRARLRIRFTLAR